ncbi:CPBP family intramembrane glutamic endopeptidase [Desulfosarcina cetonica]|uniref:CPBP family intramembrane glutamic endopeptidase n=1 Tax=Desulfosarcina cetonica TaxID=90730 RepID=UPI0006D28D6F|nr:CPBP family intramembrane glutamic endopeptidase [Desulfosarcina cetonica]
MIVLGSLAERQPAGLATLGLGRDALLPGLMKGLIGSAGFALAAGLLFIALLAAGQHPLQLIRSPLPESPYQRALFFMAGGMVAPVAEEIVFRGVIYGYLRRWGKATAVLISTALFAAFHVGPALPVTQIIGGVVFAIAYQASGSLITPIVIHGLGNLAIFTLSMC